MGVRVPSLRFRAVPASAIVLSALTVIVVLSRQRVDVSLVAGPQAPAAGIDDSPPRLARAAGTASPTKPTDAPVREALEPHARRRALDDLRADIDSRSWTRARETLDALDRASASPDDELDSLKDRFDRGRRAHFAEVASARLPEILRTKVAARVAEPDVAFIDVAAWLRKDCIEECFGALAEELGRLDPGVEVTREEPRVAWDARRAVASWRPLPRPTWDGFAPAPGATVVPRDTWWSSASVDERTTSCMWLVVSKCGLFEVEPGRFR
jgi:hypothetical protein